MAKKYIALFIAVGFLLGTVSIGLCSSVKFRYLPKCCSNTSAKSNGENCLSHCAKQQLIAVKTMGYSGEYSVLLLENRSSVYHLHNNSLLDLNSAITHFLIKYTIPKLDTSQVYLRAIFNHAPPFSLR